MKKGNEKKYQDGMSRNETPRDFTHPEDCKGSPELRTNYADSMEPSRGSRTYPSVNIIMGK